MQTKKKKLIYRTIGVLLALSFMSCCFLGYTFARYVTKGSGSMDTGVAKWDITYTYEGGKIAISEDNQVTIPTSRLSPSMAEYEEGKFRTNVTAQANVKIKNDGDVAAYISFELPDEPAVAYPYEKDADGTITETISATVHTFKKASEVQDTDDPNEPTAEEWAQIFTASIVQSTEGEDGTQTGGVTITSSDGSVSTVTPEGENSPYKGMYFVETGETLTVPIVITWTTDLMTTGTDGHTTPEEAIKAEGYPDSMNVYESDLRDSWIGANIAAIGLTFNWYALQGSEQPGP